MKTKMLLILSFLFLICLSKSLFVKSLSGKQLSTMRKDYKYLFVMYYVPWCSHCQKLAPIYQQLSYSLIKQGINITLAQVDCQQNQFTLECAGIDQYPTLIYYQNKDHVEFVGDRTYQYLYRWLTKRIKNPITHINFKQFQKLKKQNISQVSIVFEGDIKSISGQDFTSIAYNDHYNSYFYLQNKQKKESFNLHILRNFDKFITLNPNRHQIHDIIRRYDRTLIEPLDQRSITSIFRDGYLGVFFFLDPNYLQKQKQFQVAALKWKKQLANTNISFIIVRQQHQDYFGLLQHLKMNPHEMPIAIVDQKLNSKYILHQKTSQLLAYKIQQFFYKYQNKQLISQHLQQQQEQQHQHGHIHDEEHQNHHTNQDIEVQTNNTQKYNIQQIMQKFRQSQQEKQQINNNNKPELYKIQNTKIEANKNQFIDKIDKDIVIQIKKPTKNYLTIDL